MMRIALIRIALSRLFSARVLFQFQAVAIASATLAAIAPPAQAGGSPAKARPAQAVQYVKVCSLYGAGFYYIPGTDTCLKVGGFLRADTYIANVATFTRLGTYNRATDYLVTRIRPMVTLDARAQTPYGVLRSYARIGMNVVGSGATTTAFADRAFIQFAGFTLGQTVSYFDILGYSPWVTYHAVHTLGDTGGAGLNLAAYTANLGDGLSATVSLEDPALRRRGVFSYAGGVATAGAKGVNYPDIVGLVELNRAWGKVAVAGAIHDASASHYVPGAPASSSPGDATGFAATVGGYVKIPGTLGDFINFQASWGRGAMGYVTDIGAGGSTILRDGKATMAVVSDAVYGAGGGGIELTRGWSAYLGYEHGWTPAVRSSLFGSYGAIGYGAAASGLICAGAAGCDAGFSFYQAGSRLLWTPVPNLSIGLDVVYSHFNDSTPAPAAALGRGDADIWSSMLRIQRDFWPY